MSEELKTLFNDALKKAIAPLDQRKALLGERMAALVAEKAELTKARTQMVSDLASADIDMTRATGIDTRMAECDRHASLLQCAMVELGKRVANASALQAILLRVTRHGEDAVKLSSRVRAELKNGNRFSVGNRAHLLKLVDETRNCANSLMDGCKLYGLPTGKLAKALDSYCGHVEKTVSDIRNKRAAA